MSTTALAERLGVTPASVSAMIKKLAERGLVEHVPYKGVGLTAAGERVALEVLRHHRLLELYLAEQLGVPWDRVHDEAEALEHVLSEDLEARIAAKLGNPTHDPHGDPIPTAELDIEEGETQAPSAAAAPAAASCASRTPTRRCCDGSTSGACAWGPPRGGRPPAVRGAAHDALRQDQHVLGGRVARAMRVELDASVLSWSRWAGCPSLLLAAVALLAGCGGGDDCQGPGVAGARRAAACARRCAPRRP